MSYAHAHCQKYSKKSNIFKYYNLNYDFILNKCLNVFIPVTQS